MYTCVLSLRVNARQIKALATKAKRQRINITVNKRKIQQFSSISK